MKSLSFKRVSFETFFSVIQERGVVFLVLSRSALLVFGRKEYGKIVFKEICRASLVSFGVSHSHRTTHICAWFGASLEVFPHVSLEEDFERVPKGKRSCMLAIC